MFCRGGRDRPVAHTISLGYYVLLISLSLVVVLGFSFYRPSLNILWGYQGAWLTLVLLGRCLEVSPRGESLFSLYIRLGT